MSFRSPQQVINMHQYRKVPIWQRLLGGIAYPIFFYYSLKLGGMNMLPFLMMFLVMWVICRSGKINTPAFIKYHVAQAFAIGVIADVIRMLVNALLDVFLAALPFFSFLPFLDWTTQIKLGFISVWLLLLAGFALYNIALTLLGRQQEFPLSSKVAKRIVY
ncbi:MAG: hypothetical protein ACK5T0_09395 [Vampirovibrionales bacterium]